MSEGVPVSVPVSAGAGSRLVLGRLHMTAEIVAAEICDFNRNFQSNVAPTKTMKDPQRFFFTPLLFNTGYARVELLPPVALYQRRRRKGVSVSRFGLEAK